MACSIAAINQSVGNTDCGSVGGIKNTWAIPCEDVSDVTIGADGNGDDQITAITLAAMKSFAKLVPDDDDTAFYNQEANREGKRITFTQEAFLKFEKVNGAKIQAANDAAECCCIVAVHEFQSGPFLVQGIDKRDNVAGWDFAKTNARVSPNVLSDTGENADRVEYTIESEGVTLSIPMDPTIDLDSLVGS